MKSVVFTLSMLAMVGSPEAQQPAIDHSHAHEMQATPTQTPAAQTPARQAPATGQPPTAPGGGGRGGPQIEVPWNDAIRQATPSTRQGPSRNPAATANGPI